MAQVSVILAELGDEGAATISYIWDDVTHKLVSATLVNNGTKNNLTLILRDPTTRAIVFNQSRGFGTGTFTFDLTGQNISLVFNAAKNRWSLPFIVETTWA